MENYIPRLNHQEIEPAVKRQGASYQPTSTKRPLVHSDIDSSELPYCLIKEPYTKHTLRFIF